MDSDLMIRRAGDSESDCRLVYGLSNDPVVRSNSFNTGRIDWDDHVVWYKRMIESRNALLYLAFSAGQFVGQVRFSRGEELSRECTISISIARAFRGRHVGGRLMSRCIERMSRDWPGVHSVLAEVRSDNAASSMLFQKGGFALEMTVNRYRYETTPPPGV